MNIAIIAQNRKKELMVQFCIAYCGLLAKHNLCATATTGKMIIDATGLRIDCLLPGSTGGFGAGGSTATGGVSGCTGLAGGSAGVSGCLGGSGAAATAATAYRLT